MPQIFAYGPKESLMGRISIKKGVVVFRNAYEPNDRIGTEGENDQFFLQHFLADLGGSIVRLELQPDEVLAVLFDIKENYPLKITEPLDLRGRVGVNVLKMSASEIMEKVGKSH